MFIRSKPSIKGASLLLFRKITESHSLAASVLQRNENYNIEIIVGRKVGDLSGRVVGGGVSLRVII